jgi:hypothetical protein
MIAISYDVAGGSSGGGGGIVVIWDQCTCGGVKQVAVGIWAIAGHMANASAV